MKKRPAFVQIRGGRRRLRLPYLGVRPDYGATVSKGVVVDDVQDDILDVGQRRGAGQIEPQPNRALAGEVEGLQAYAFVIRIKNAS